MKLGRFIQRIIVVVVWAIILIAIVAVSFISAALNWSLPVWWLVIPIIFGLLATVVLTSKEIISELNGEIEREFAKLSDAEMLEVLAAMDEVKENIGIDIELPLKSKKRKREDVDKAIRNLSDTELLHLKDQLRDGNIEEEKLLAWLNSQREMRE